MKSFILILMSIPLFSSAQQFTQKENKLVYEYVETSKGLNKAEIFAHAKAWLTEKGKIVSEDKDAGLITGSGTFPITITEGDEKGRRVGSYKIDIIAKDERYKIVLHNMNYDFRSALESLYMASQNDKQNKTYSEVFTAFDAFFNRVKTELSGKMTKSDF